MLRCQSCSSTALIDFDAAVICKDCGVVAEESQIVSDVTFAENSAGGAVVQGSYVGNEQRGARTIGPGGYRTGGAGVSREQTVSNAKHAIRALGSAKRVPPTTIDKAGRLFQLALEGGSYQASGNEPKNYVLGRRSEYTQASCLYVACRLDRTNHMLIDFADAIGVNVFILGRSYLRLVRCLEFKIPMIDPSIYISRFASLLDFGDETQKVATDATRLVQRLKKDWISHGRRPAGICGAALIIAARMNNFRRSTAEVVQVVKIADITLRKRLEDFQRTASSRLTIDDFRKIWLEEEEEPPAYYLARLPKQKKKESRAAQRKRLIKLGLEDDDGRASDADSDEEEQGEGGENGEDAGQEQGAIDPRLEELANEATEAEITRYLHDPLEEASAGNGNGVNGDGAEPQKRTDSQEPEGVDELAGLDEEELDAFILNEAEVKIKERVWIEFNRDHLEKMLAKELKREADIEAGVAPKPIQRKKRKAPRETSRAPSTAAESTEQLMRRRHFSKKLNYKVLEQLFETEEPRRSKRSRGESAASDGDGATDRYRSDAETTDAENGRSSPKLSNRQRKKREREARKAGARSSANEGGATTGDESGTERGASRGVTDADTDAEELPEWRKGLVAHQNAYRPRQESEF